jgi:uncharacterized protein (DUF1684 family)
LCSGGIEPGTPDKGEVDDFKSIWAHVPGTASILMLDRLELLDWKREVFSLYHGIRADADPESVWTRWRERRDDLFREHPQSPLPADQRPDFLGLNLFDYDPGARAIAEITTAAEESYQVPSSGDGTFTFTRFATASFELGRDELRLELYWLEGYGGGLFLPFRDETSGDETYGAGRYLLDTIKGADLGMHESGLVLDFNYAYNPSCAYDPQWVCPLAPPPNRLAVPIQAGEKSPS